MTLHVSLAEVDGVAAIEVPQLHGFTTFKSDTVVLAGVKHVLIMYIG